MKKLLLFAIISVTVSSFIYGQSFQLLDHLNNDKTAQTVELWADSGGVMSYDVKLKNTSASTKTVKIKVIPNYLVSGSTYNYCLPPPNGICYPYTSNGATEVSLTSVDVAASSSISYFILDSYPSGKIGVASVTYVIFDENNASDSTYITLIYNATAVGIHESELPSNAIGNVYPNPSNSLASLNYNLEGYNQKAKVVLYDILGNTLKEFQLNGNTQGKVNINTAEMPNGVYFYALRNQSNKTITTKSLIINH